MDKWEDTVMKQVELKAINDAMPSDAKYGDVFEVIAEKQAEISFKAGKEEGKQEGFDEAVGWREENCIGVNTPTQDPDDYMGIQSMAWQAFKERGK